MLGLQAGSAALIHAIMRNDVTVLSGETDCKHATELILARGLPGAPVVDDRHRLIGYITLSDLLRYYYSEHNVLASSTVFERMSPVACVLGWDSSLPHTISALAASASWLPELPVVSVDGTVIGLVGAVDVLRFQILANLAVHG